MGHINGFVQGGHVNCIFLFVQRGHVNCIFLFVQRSCEHFSFCIEMSCDTFFFLYREIM